MENGKVSTNPARLVRTRKENNARLRYLSRVEFRPDRQLFASGTKPIVLLRNLAALGTVSCCQLHTEDLPALADLDPALCYLSWTVELASVCAEAELREVFEFAEHPAEISMRLAASSRLRPCWLRRDGACQWGHLRSAAVVCRGIRGLY